MRKFAFSLSTAALFLSPAVARLAGPVAAAIAFAPARAEASCVMPRAFLSPASGAKLPPSPTLYVFAPARVVDDLGRPKPPFVRVFDPKGRPLPHTLAEVSTPGPLGVYRLDVAPGSSPRVRVTLVASGDGAAAPLQAEYAIDRAWATPPHSPPEVLGAEPETSLWACSYTELQRLRLAPSVGQAPSAYRVSWASANDQRFGSLLLPPSTSGFFHAPPSPSATDEGVDLLLGHVSCLGPTFAWGESDVDVRVSALFADGSESAPSERSLRVAPPAPASRPSEPATPPAPAPLANEPARPADPGATGRWLARASDPKTLALAAALSFVTAALAAFFRRGARP